MATLFQVPQPTSGRQEAMRKEKGKLDKLVSKSDRVLYTIKGVFPFNFFPDEVILDENKVSVMKRLFFKTGEIRSVAYDDIFNVVTTFGPVFATLEIVDRFFAQAPLVIPYLMKEDARKARRLIQGIILARREGVDLAMLSMDELREKLETLGKSNEGRSAVSS